jgi:4-hydroxybenzoate polyprenyltransferase
MRAVRALVALLELVRFSHTLFALPFALLAAALAWHAGSLAVPPQPFRWRDLMGIVICMVCARTAAMAFNRLVDRRLDAQNPRTADRHLPAGTVAPAHVVVWVLLSSAGFVAGTRLFFPNRLPLLLALPVLGFLLAYSYAKRFTAAAHFWLGAALMLAPVSAWIAIRGEQVMKNPWDIAPALVLGGAVLLWVAGFDMIYACQDEAFDRKAGLNSAPARWGIRGALLLAATCHAGTIVLLAALPLAYRPLGLIYALGVATVAVLLLYEHAIVKPDDLSRVNVAFFQVNAVLSLGMLAATLVDLLL